MDRFRYGTKEIIATMVSCILIAFVKYAEERMLSGGILSEQVLSRMSFGVLIVAVAAVFFGPVSAALSGFGGVLLTSLILGGDIDYLILLILGIYGFSLGLYFGRMHYDPRKFTYRTILDFNAILIIEMIICCMFIIPLLRFMINDTDLYEEITIGAQRTVGNCLLTGVICPVIMLVASLILKERSRKAA